MKRFYTIVSTAKANGGYHILLDDRPVKTKDGVFLCAGNEQIATRVMQEWAEQKEDIIPETMPFTQILNTKIDRVSKERDAMTASVLKYLDTDLLCYCAAEPEVLAKQQQEKWKPWLDWFEQDFGCVLKTTTSLIALTQSKKAHEAAASYVKTLNDDYFTILQLVTSVSGSLILAMALTHGAASAQQIFEACFVEETFKDTLYNAEKYGADPAMEKIQKSALQDFQVAQDYIAML